MAKHRLRWTSISQCSTAASALNGSHFSGGGLLLTFLHPEFFRVH
jgi:hypothetical protein